MAHSTKSIAFSRENTFSSGTLYQAEVCVQPMKHENVVGDKLLDQVELMSLKQIRLIFGPHVDMSEAAPLAEKLFSSVEGKITADVVCALTASLHAILAKAIEEGISLLQAKGSVRVQ